MSALSRELRIANARGVHPPQNWSSRAAEEIENLEHRLAVAEGAALLNAETIHNMAQAGAEVDRDAGC